MTVRGDEWLREAEPRHSCALPDHANAGDVWRCACGRRWTCIDRITRTGTLVTMRACWRRRWWPWPK